MRLLFKSREGGSDIREVSMEVGVLVVVFDRIIGCRCNVCVFCEGDEQSMAEGGWLMVWASQTRRRSRYTSGSLLCICSSVIVVVIGPRLDAPDGAGRFLGGDRERRGGLVTACAILLHEGV